MKHIFRTIFLFLVFLIMVNCNTTKLVKQWKNPDIESLYMSKVLIVGMTPNINNRKEFELQLKKEFEARGIEAIISLKVFEPGFTGKKVNALELETIENILDANYFDAILYTKLIGSETKLAYSNTYKNSKYLNVKFKEDYYEHQEIFFNHKYYDKYNVYHAETSLFCICPTADRELVWKGFIDISNPTSAEKSLKDYVKVLILALEEQLLLPKLYKN